MNRPRVAVLLATFNGEAFLAPQLASLSAQFGVEVEVFAQDDGSTDDTCGVLSRHARAWSNLAEPMSGRGAGPAVNFLDLLAKAPEGFDAYAFCDQDDVWCPDKLFRAMEGLAKAPPGPALYCARVTYTDADLRPLGLSPPGADTRFEHLLFENVAFGNTVVMNPAARDLILAAPPRGGMIMHDWWCALVVSAFGAVVHDDESRVLYRQHGRNVIGASADRASEILRHITLFCRNPRAFYPIHGQAEEFIRRFGDKLPASRLRLAQRLVLSRDTLAGRLRFALSRDFIRRRPIDALAGRLLLAAGFY